jgi:hypothetical protein
MESIVLLVSVQCRNAILVYRPDGSEVTDRNSAQTVDLQAGRILRIDQPEPGPWRVRLAGQGLFVLSLLTKSNLALTGVAFSPPRGAVNEEEPPLRTIAPLFGARQDVEVRLKGEVSDLRLQLVDATGERVSDIVPLERTGEGVYLGSVVPQAQRFRLLVTGVGPMARPFERMHPVLFQAQPPK